MDQVFFLRATQYLVNETEYIPWVAAISNLGYIHRMLQYTPTYGHFQVRIRACA